MKATLIKIGNSQGVRLPKAILEQANFGRELDITVENGTIVIRPAIDPRQGWEEEAEECHRLGEDSFEEWDVTLNDFDGTW